MQTNAENKGEARTLAYVGANNLLCLTVTKRGVQRGRDPHKRVYGDDKVKVLLWGGWEYPQVAALSLQGMDRIRDREGLFGALEALGESLGHTYTSEEVFQAVLETRTALTSASRFKSEPRHESWGRGNFQPLTVSGYEVPGCRIYYNPLQVVRPGQRSPEHGSIYVSGLKIAQRVLEPAPNGPWVPNSSGLAQAKEDLRSRLPVGSWVRYALSPKEPHDLSVGEAALEAAHLGGLEVPEDKIRALYDLDRAFSNLI